MARTNGRVAFASRTVKSREGQETFAVIVVSIRILSVEPASLYLVAPTLLHPLLYGQLDSQQVDGTSHKDRFPQDLPNIAVESGVTVLSVDLKKFLAKSHTAQWDSLD